MVNLQNKNKGKKVEKSILCLNINFNKKTLYFLLSNWDILHEVCEWLTLLSSIFIFQNFSVVWISVSDHSGGSRGSGAEADKTDYCLK